MQEFHLAAQPSRWQKTCRQIYEISTPDEARSISAIGVDQIGVLARNGEFPRELPVQSGSREKRYGAVIYRLFPQFEKAAYSASGMAA